mmetsp:Transcript_59726/g.71760  ORF Transcript_59726/g.71760 Transcript_59726/m.71760 type:complete len:466 (+) Transcript_59726:120-1517(+)
MKLKMAQGRHLFLFLHLFGMICPIVCFSHSKVSYIIEQPKLVSHSLSLCAPKTDQNEACLIGRSGLKRKRAIMGMNSESSNSANDGFGKLTSALTVLDKKWQVQQRNPRGRGTWKTLLLDDEEEEEMQENPAYSDATNAKDFVYLLEPINGSSIPSSLIIFYGGAALGQFPHIAYAEFLNRVSSKTGCAVICVPFEVGLNHFELSSKCFKLAQRAIAKCENDMDWSNALPKFMLGHSLGAKLHVISMAATGSGDNLEDVHGIGLISYNNFSFGATIGMAKSFLGTLQGNQSGDILETYEDDTLLGQIFNFAEQAATFAGIDFVPSPTDTDRLVEMKFNSDLQSKTRLFSFDDDDLDSGYSLFKSFRAVNGVRDEVSSSGLPGSHLTPVFLKLGLDDLPEEARAVADQVTGGIESAAFGDENHIDMLVDEIGNWMVGKSPARKANWKLQDVTPLLPGSVLDAEVDP